MSKPMYSVAGLVKYIKGSLDHDMNLQSILVKGEVSNFTNHRSGHWYFSLKDNKAKISCVMFSSYACRCKMLLKEGMKVIVSASVSMYEASGTTQLYVTAVQQDGLGDLFLQLEEVKNRMRLEGCFDEARKKPLPAYPMNIAIITAKTGAAVQDILTTISRRWPICEVSVYPSLVQGISATKNLIENLEKADAMKHDVILLARGGGAIEDLWCFNEEALARAILKCETPVVTGVGHETDTTLVDYVSDARAPTPTAAAELITPNIEEVKSSLSDIRVRMIQDMRQLYMEKKHQLVQIKENRYLKDPMSYIMKEQMTLAMHVQSLGKVESMIKTQKSSLQQLSNALAIYAKKIASENEKQMQSQKDLLIYTMKQFENKQKQAYATKLSLLDAYSPLKILERGYAITYQDDHVVKSIHDIKENDSIRVRMQDGFIHADVKKKEELS
ncbi:exodeoxyribonuclease VII large subunit [Absiella sp. AM29-15]|uniref:exodeoxyribonuclease VII large subunit n=1 Tax=Absiella sp. AM29-15 TaxID=2292278 RepID=UPI000E40390B|nr:exodeoxyribonuclease VII large subunit [Absiella sp. AM29-15]RGC52660.1 exodeoxyribonuclease VII large subunit [Absiella sp. AM29-15]